MPPADLEEGYLRARTLDSEHVFLARRMLPLLKMRALGHVAPYQKCSPLGYIQIAFVPFYNSKYEGTNVCC